MSSTLEQIREFTTLGEARAFAVEMMDSDHLVDVRQQAVYKTLPRLPLSMLRLGLNTDRFGRIGVPAISHAGPMWAAVRRACLPMSY